MDNKNQKLSGAIFEQVARIGKAVSNPKRLEILELLCQAPRTVDWLAQETHMSQANTSQHLQALRHSQLVVTRREGTSIWYSLTDEMVAEFFRSLRVLAVTHLAELDRIVGDYFSDESDLEPVDKKTLISRARKGEVTVIDVRPPEEYLAGHIPGALSIPMDDLETRIAEIPSNTQVIAYCRGPYCVWSGQAVEVLKQHGYQAGHLADGVIDWRARGYKVATGANP